MEKTSLGAKTLAVPTPAWVIGTYDTEGKANGMVAAWGGIACSKPVCMTVSLRQATHTYGAIMERKAYTISICSQDQVGLMDYFGLSSGRDTDKFADLGLTPVRGQYVDAPYVGEFPMAIECKLLQTVDLGLHTQFIGEVLDVKVDPGCLDDADNPVMDKVLPVLFGPGARQYWGVGPFLGKAFSIGKK